MGGAFLLELTSWQVVMETVSACHLVRESEIEFEELRLGLEMIEVPLHAEKM